MSVESKHNDSLLWDKFLQGDNDAYSLIYQMYVQVMFSYGLKFTKDRELVKDSIHDVFVKLYRDRTKFGETDNIKFYLFVLLKNTMLNILKRKSIHQTFLEQLDESKYIESSTDEIVENQEENSINQAKLEHILSVLTPRQREVMYYRYVEGMEISEIAQLMDMNYQSVVNLCQRSLKKIKESYIYLFYLLCWGVGSPF